MSEPRNSGDRLRRKITARTSPIHDGKPFAQVPSSAKTIRKPRFRLYRDGDDDFVMSLPGTKRGPLPNHRADLFRFRDDLVMPLESYWPELQSLCLKPIDKPRLLSVLAAIHKKLQTEASKHLVENIDSLIELIKKNQVRNDPRRVANALAGVPKITLMTSLRKCGTKINRCPAPIYERARRAHIERKHKRFARMLSFVRPGDTDGYNQALKDYDLRDPHIYLGKKRAERLQYIWEQGAANWSALGMMRP